MSSKSYWVKIVEGGDSSTDDVAVEAADKNRRPIENKWHQQEAETSHGAVAIVAVKYLLCDVGTIWVSETEPTAWPVVYSIHHVTQRRDLDTIPNTAEA